MPQRFLSLGETPVANALVREDQLDRPQRRFPLVIAFCPACTLVQVTEELSAAELFPEEYPYFSSFSDQIIDHARAHALALIDERGLNGESLVVEVGSNDGYLLQHFAEHGISVLGIDPAPGPVEAARERGVPTLTDFFGAELARRLRAEGRVADVIIANNVMAHTPDLNGFVEGLAVLLADEGVVTVENPYVRELITDREFDTIYHEHFCYFSCTAVHRLMQRHGLSLNRVQPFPIHGGTLRWWIGRRPEVESSARAYLREEEEAGVTRFGFYERFADEVEEVKRGLLELLRGIANEGGRVFAYGAAAKGSTLLNSAGIGRDLVAYVVDRNVHKQGLRMPGVLLPIHDPTRLLEDQPDFLLLLAWNFKDEIMRQQEEYRRRGGRFIVPLPAPEVI